MKTLYQFTAGIFLCSFMLIAGSKVNSEKLDWRLLQAVESSVKTRNAIHSSIFSKYSQSVPLYSVIVYASSINEAVALGIQPRSFNGKLFTAFVTKYQLAALSNAQSVSYIAAPRKLYPKLNKSLVDMKVDKVHTGVVNSTNYKGSGVIVGVIDSGIDWKHQDFRKDSDTTKTRIRFLWDQTDGRSGVGPSGYNYGAEYDSTEINNELDGTPANAVLQQDFSGHGTHVASIAAGDGSASNGTYTGVAPEAELIIVKAGDESFESDHVIDAITYIREKATALGKPFVINISLGGHDGAHDGTRPEEVAIDAELDNASGRQIVIAAGNEGVDSIHAGGTVTQGGQSVIKLVIPSYTPNSGNQNDYVYLSMWYKGGDNLTVTVARPNGSSVTAASGQTQTGDDPQGSIQILNANDGAVSNAQKKECAITLIDFNTSPAPAAGEWTVTVSGALVTQGGTFDIWIASSTMVGSNNNAVKFTSGATNTKLVGMPGTAEKSITVGSYVTKWSWTDFNNNTWAYSNVVNRTNDYSTFSSMGPTRDGRQKPDVSAPGQAIAAAMSNSTAPSTQLQVAPAGKYVIEQGTSMASPHVAGLVALMLQAKPTLTAAEIRAKLINTVKRDTFTSYLPTAQWGSGKVDAVAVLQNVLSVQREYNAIPTEFVLQQNYPNPFNPATKIGFKLHAAGFTSLIVWDVLGRKVATLVNEKMEAGEYSVVFHAENLTSGVYFYTLQSGNNSVTKKMMLVR